jgi:hypothetical protein
MAFFCIALSLGQTDFFGNYHANQVPVGDVIVEAGTINYVCGRTPLVTLAAGATLTANVTLGLPPTQAATSTVMMGSSTTTITMAG